MCIRDSHHKVLLAVAFVLIVVATPTGVFWPYAVHAALLLGAVALSRVPPAYLARRMVVEVPFVVLAFVEGVAVAVSYA